MTLKEKSEELVRKYYHSKGIDIEKSINHENGNEANRLLAVVLISLVWIAVLTIAIILAWLFDGGELFIRTILILPFLFGGIYASRSVWKRYR